VDDRQNRAWLRRFHAAPFLLGISLFVVNEAPVLSGYLAPPPGYVASLLPQNMDFLQYQTWINAYQRTNGWLLTDYHAPWATEPALLNPFCWLIGRTSALFGVDGLWIFHLVYLALSIAGGYALFFTLRAFTYSRLEARLALLVSFFCVPVASVLALSTYLLGRPIHGLLSYGLPVRSTAASTTMALSMVSPEVHRCSSVPSQPSYAWGSWRSILRPTCQSTCSGPAWLGPSARSSTPSRYW
jgi:hypothetical protein